MKTFYIKGSVPSSKNGRQWTGKFLIKSKQWKAFEEQAIPQIQSIKDEFLEELSKHEKPYSIGYYHKRKTRHRFDYTNSIQGLEDIMVHEGLLEDDNTSIYCPVFMGYELDPDDPGCYITILDENLYLKKPVAD